MKFVINKQTGFFVLQEQEEGESALEKVANTAYTEEGNNVTDPEKLVTDKKQNFIVNALDKLFGGKPPKVLNIEQAYILINKLENANFDERLKTVSNFIIESIKPLNDIDDQTYDRLYLYGMSKVFYTYLNSVANDEEQSIGTKFEKIQQDFTKEIEAFKNPKTKNNTLKQMEKNTLEYVKYYSSIIEAIKRKKQKIETKRVNVLNQEVDASFEDLQNQVRIDDARDTLLSDVYKPIIGKVIRENSEHTDALSPLYDFITGDSEDVPTEEQVTIFKNLLDKDISDEDIKKTINSKLDILLKVKKSSDSTPDEEVEAARNYVRGLLSAIEDLGELLPPEGPIASIIAGLIRVALCLPEENFLDNIMEFKLDFSSIKNVLLKLPQNVGALGALKLIKNLFIVLKNPKTCPEGFRGRSLAKLLVSSGLAAIGGAYVKGGGAAVKAVTENKKLIKEYREEINNLLIPHMQKQLGFNHPPTINFADDQGNAQDMFGKTAYYNPSTSEITVYVTNRHPKDIMRSVAHEIVHHAQNQRGEFENSFNLGEEGYAQNNSHLRSMEEEAYLSGNMMFRDWEDNLKKQRNQNNMVNETKLRTMIRSMIAEEIANQTENEPAEQKCDGDSDCGCDKCNEKKTFLKNKGVKNIAEEVEKEIMPLREWRNMELNSLLLNRFGISSPHVLGEKKNKKPDADGDGVPDWVDKKPKDPKVGAKKTPTKKGKIPPQFLKGKKKDESK